MEGLLVMILHWGLNIFLSNTHLKGNNNPMAAVNFFEVENNIFYPQSTAEKSVSAWWPKNLSCPALKSSPKVRMVCGLWCLGSFRPQTHTD